MKFREITFTDADVVNPDEFIPAARKGERAYNPHNVRPFLLHDHGFAVAVVFSSNLQDALDEACDADKLDRYAIDLDDESTRADYLTADFAEADAGLDEKCPEWTAPDGTRYWWIEGRCPTFLGNASEPFDLDGLDWIELPNPPFSFCAQLEAHLSAIAK